MELIDKIRILADSAKYDVSCSSSGSDRENKRINNKTHELDKIQDNAESGGKTKV